LNKNKQLLDSFLDEKAEFLRLLKQHNLEINEYESIDYPGKLVFYKVAISGLASPTRSPPSTTTSGWLNASSKSVVVEFDKSKKLINFYCPFNSSLLCSQIDLEWLPSNISSWLYDTYLGY